MPTPHILKRNTENKEIYQKYWEVIIYKEVNKILLTKYEPKTCECGFFPIIRYSIKHLKFYQDVGSLKEYEERIFGSMQVFCLLASK